MGHEMGWGGISLQLQKLCDVDRRMLLPTCREIRLARIMIVLIASDMMKGMKIVVCYGCVELLCK